MPMKKLGVVAVLATSLASYTPSNIPTHARIEAIEAAVARIKIQIRSRKRRDEIESDIAIIINNLAGLLDNA